MTAGEEFQRLVEIMHRLRRECPWDRTQSHMSLRAFLLEETYETLQALDAAAPAELCEELGDLTVQVVFHAELAQEAGQFDIADVLRGINEKLVRRHPHVFGDEIHETAADVHRRWEDIKTSQEQKASCLEGVPAELPALLKAARVLAKMRQNGVDPFDGRDPAAEARRRLDELASACAEADPARAGRAAGLLCLAVAELADRAGADAEDSLREAVGRLMEAFQREEAALRQRGLRLAQLAGGELDRIAAGLLPGFEET
jgi:tetrapyrrole methylase family protein/MazG family protein